MKLLRIWLVVLLTVLLPIRGAMAVTMPCAPAGGMNQAELHGQHAGEHVHGNHADGHAIHGDSGDPHAGHDHATSKCSMCSASCSVPPVPSTSAGLEEPLVLTSVSFPDLCAPAATFQSDGQERPPRTL